MHELRLFEQTAGKADENCPTVLSRISEHSFNNTKQCQCYVALRTYDLMLSQGILLLLLSSAAPAAVLAKPHIFHVIVDDLGWGNTGYHRTGNDTTPEVQTPYMDSLVKDGIQLMRHYVHAMCT